MGPAPTVDHRGMSQLQTQRTATVPTSPEAGLRPYRLPSATRRAELERAEGTRPLVRVLLVEDDPELREALQLRLRAMGCSVSSVCDGVTARWSLLTLRFDAVVLDLGLPSKSGFDVMVDVAAENCLPPVLVLTGADEEDQELARTLGAQHVLRKPSSFKEITNVLKSMLSL